MKQDSSGTYVKKVYAVSAMNGKGTEPIREYLKKSLPLSEWLYPPDQISDIPMRNIAAEITRESIILRAHEEVPYAAYVETESFQEQANGSVRIEQQVRAFPPLVIMSHGLWVAIRLHHAHPQPIVSRGSLRGRRIHSRGAWPLGVPTWAQHDGSAPDRRAQNK